MVKRLSIVTTAIVFALGCVSGSQTDQPASDQQATETEASTMSETPGGPPAVPGDTVTTSSGLKYIVIQSGSGPAAESGQQVRVHYTGWLTDGTKFDSSVDRGDPFTFPLGQGRVIRGWDEGVAGMNVGEKRRLVIPAELGYGSRGAGGVIPPGATLVFDVELLGVQ